MTNDQLIEQFHKDHQVIYSIVATVDGVIAAQVSNELSADQAAGSAWLVDDAILTLAHAEAADKADLKSSTDTDQKIANERGL